MRHVVAVAGIMVMATACTTPRTAPTCLQPPSTVNLKRIQMSDERWKAAKDWRLLRPHNTVQVCRDHFPPGSPSAVFTENAITEFNRISGVDLNFSVVYQPHLRKRQIFSSSPGNHYDYVEHRRGRADFDGFPHPCHPRNPSACGKHGEESGNGFAMNTCAFDGDWGHQSKPVQAFAVTINAACYGSDEFPEDALRHEWMHVVGLRHFRTWSNVDENGYLSAVNSSLKHPTAFDAAFMRHYYPKQDGIKTVNIVSSEALKVRDGEGGWKRRPLEEKDATHLRAFLENGILYDCGAHMFKHGMRIGPRLGAGWFNTGNRDQEDGRCMIHQIELSKKDGSYRRQVAEWRAAPMPAESQDHWREHVSIAVPELKDLFDGTTANFSLNFELRFKANAYDRAAELSAADNDAVYGLTIYRSAAHCPRDLSIY